MAEPVNILDDWELVRRIHAEDTFTSTPNLHEAIERMIRVLAAYEVVSSEQPEAALKRLHGDKWDAPIYTLQPVYDIATETYRWKMKIFFQEGTVKREFASKPCPTMEEAVQELFDHVLKFLDASQKGEEEEALLAEQHLAYHRRVSHDIGRLKNQLGAYMPDQPNLPLGEKAKP